MNYLNARQTTMLVAVVVDSHDFARYSSARCSLIKNVGNGSTVAVAVIVVVVGVH